MPCITGFDFKKLIKHADFKYQTCLDKFICRCKLDDIWVDEILQNMSSIKLHNNRGLI